MALRASKQHAQPFYTRSSHRRSDHRKLANNTHAHTTPCTHRPTGDPHMPTPTRIHTTNPPTPTPPYTHELTGDELEHHACKRPHIGRCIVACAQDHFRRSVLSSLNILCEVLVCKTSVACGDGREGVGREGGRFRSTCQDRSTQIHTRYAFVISMVLIQK